MEVHLTPEKEAVDRLLDEDARFRAAVRKGFASLDRGEFIEEDEMHARIERMLRPFRESGAARRTVHE